MTIVDERQAIGNRLKEAREYLDISQDEVASVLKISRSAVSLIESGQRKLEALELMKLSKIYQRPMAYFTTDDFSVEQDPDAAVLARSFFSLSDKDKQELLNFAEFLQLKATK